MPIAVIAPLQGDADDFEALDCEFAPRREDVPLCHFIPYEFFLTLLRQRRIRLRRMDSFTDAADGLPPEANQVTRSPMAASLARSLPAVEDAAAMRLNHEILRARSYAHCWYASEPRSRQMWQQYGEAGRGVCIWSSSHRLINALEAQMPGHLEFRIGRCYYRNEDHPTPALWLTNSLYRKQRLYEHEDEFRVIGILKDAHVTSGAASGIIGLPQAEYMPVNLQVLIARVLVGPAFPAFRLPELQRELQNAGLDVPLGVFSSPL